MVDVHILYTILKELPTIDSVHIKTDRWKKEWYNASSEYVEGITITLNECKALTCSYVYSVELEDIILSIKRRLREHIIREYQNVRSDIDSLFDRKKKLRKELLKLKETF